MIRGSMEVQNGPEQMSKELAKATSEAMADAVQFWHGRFLPQHFETSAVQRYSYQKRSKKYMIRKARKWGHQNPLVWSGRMRQMVLRAIALRHTRTGAEGRLTGPRYLWAFRKDQGASDKAKEVTAVHPSELAVMQQSIDAGVTRRLNNARRWFTVRRF